MHVIATAGHVDHGKSTLVRALTGIEPDRWAEERLRGMTIDLGFAWTTLPQGPTVAFVDVPGHERFIGNMLAGVGPAPAVMMVVGADEGWRTQSAEHLAAVDALGIRHGLLVVTRSDLADPGAATEQALEQMMATSLGAVEAVQVSGRTGTGLDLLRQALARLVVRLPQPRIDGRVRLWVDRSFTIRGSGTVVTGTLGAGTLAVGDTLMLEDRSVRIRGFADAGPGSGSGPGRQQSRCQSERRDSTGGSPRGGADDAGSLGVNQRDRRADHGGIRSAFDQCVAAPGVRRFPGPDPPTG